jgi:hypothetical protein
MKQRQYTVPARRKESKAFIDVLAREISTVAEGGVPSERPITLICMRDLATGM